ncbi:CaiB/BaiF CoA transferase family protein [Novosphingobium kaempferiae]|uniref:CaiB/BaiF CoA transferase family protein n=1 Tax=Novosphingobium kaempferiae TaxID=2896849 RepID=UPI001E4D4191|nr:CaiB/BaiF CoA-transferase family protein [Novosphingobium kaempferiae]
MAGSDDQNGFAGPLAGIRMVEFAGLGPLPHCVRMLAGLGADVIRIERKGPQPLTDPNAAFGRAVLPLDLSNEDDRQTALALCTKADIVVEGFRPGVMERLGLGPEQLLAANPRLIYGRMTGWGQTGPLSRTAGHDITYLAITGALAAMGDPAAPPRPPLNLVGDYGGGSFLLAFGLLAALHERTGSGRGQIVDAAIIDGVGSMMATFAEGALSLDRNASLLGGAAPFYRCYRCADGLDIAVGAIEPHFYAELLRSIDAPAHLLEDQYREETWPAHSAHLAAIFVTRPRDEWLERLAGSEACAAPVLPLGEATLHPQIATRNARSHLSPAPLGDPVPRFSRTPGAWRANGDALARMDIWGLDIAAQDIPS